MTSERPALCHGTTANVAARSIEGETSRVGSGTIRVSSTSGWTCRWCSAVKWISPAGFGAAGGATRVRSPNEEPRAAPQAPSCLECAPGCGARPRSSPLGRIPDICSVAFPNSAGRGREQVIGTIKERARCAIKKRDHAHEAVREELKAQPHIIFSANPGDREFFLGNKPGFGRDYIEAMYGSLKPCLHGSDAHEVTDIRPPV
jgi:hypothetical protein